MDHSPDASSQLTFHRSLLLLPPAPGNTSIANKLVEHLSHRFPQCEHRDFSLDYNLFSDTSSQLPGSDVAQRSFTHIFASSHDPERGYARATKPGQPDDGECITIAAESIEPFVTLTLTKLQPLWYHRQHLKVEEGISVSLKNNEWILSLGDVRMASKSPSSSTLRGTIIELHHMIPSPDEEKIEEQTSHMLFQDVVSKIFHGTGENFGEAKFILGETLARSPVSHRSRPADWELAYIYMRTLRGQR